MWEKYLQTTDQEFENSSNQDFEIQICQGVLHKAQPLSTQAMANNSIIWIVHRSPFLLGVGSLGSV